MAEIVAAILASHAPLITGKPHIADSSQKERFYASFTELHQRLHAAKPDAVVVIANDHMHNFNYDNIPAFCIGLAPEYQSDQDARLTKITPASIKGASDLAMDLLEEGLSQGIDFAYSYSIHPGHELSVPLHFLDPHHTLPILPIYINCGAPPLPTMQRCYSVGQFIGDFIRSYPKAQRIALLATGGLSHSVGTPDTGKINPDFDQFVLEHIRSGNFAPLTELSWEEIEREGGNGGQEIRNWICLLGAIPHWRGEILSYEPVPEWITGSATVWMQS